MKYELKSIPVWGFTKITFFVNLAAGFILGILLTPFTGILLVMIAGFLEMRTGSRDISNSLDSLIVIMPLITSLCFAFFLTLFEFIIVLLYNMFSRMLGGLEVKLELADVSTDKKSEQRQESIVKKEPDSSLKPETIKISQTDEQTINHNNSDSPPPPPPPIGKSAESISPAAETVDSVIKKEKKAMTDKPVRVRIAPSPSGYLHVGTARMAIANFLYARHTGGQFLIRIENTDAARSDASLVEPILSALEWLGITSDEEVVYQSDRAETYKKNAKQILENGHGYRCFCTSEQLAADREEAVANKGPLQYNRRCLKLSPQEIDEKVAAGVPYTIRLKIPEGVTKFNDIVSDELKRDNKEIEDLIIARSDGTATYNLAVVVDDHEMGITHVIRGNDHVTNTFKQIHIYHALGFELPVFGHVPLILRPDKKKVSKRLGDKDVAQYRNEGILPEAMFNFLSLLGWSSKDDKEIYTVEELIKVFDPNNFNASNAVFDEEKLEAFNKEHIFMKSDHELAVLVAPLLVEAGYTTKYWLETRWEFLRNIIALLKPRVRRISDFVEQSKYFFEFDYIFDPKAEEKQFTAEGAEILTELANRFEAIENFTKETAESALTSMSEDKELKKGKLIHPTRLAVSGSPNGPGLYDMLVLIGKDEVVTRMKKTVEIINNKITG